MQVQNQYDVIVVGNQLSGYFFAAAAAQQGKNVLIIEGRQPASTVFERPSGAFLLDSSWEPLLGLSKNSKTNAFLTNIGLYNNIDDLFPAYSPAVQLISTQGRFNIETPSQLHHVDKIKTMESALYGSLVLGTASQRKKRQSKILPLNTRFIIGGKDAIKEILTSRLKYYGGTIKRATNVEAVVFEKNKLSGVLLSSYEGFVRSPIVVGSMGAAAFLKLLPKEVISRKLVQEVNTLRPKYWRLVYAVKVPAYAIPEGMASHVCYRNFEYSSEEHFLQIFSLPRNSYSGIQPQERILLVRLLLPYEEKTIRPHTISVIMKRSLKRLEDFIPFLSQELISVTPNPWKLAEDALFQRYYAFNKLSDIPSDNLVYQLQSSKISNIGVRANWGGFGLHGLALCSRDVYPKDGFIGEAIAARLLMNDLQQQRL